MNKLVKIIPEESKDERVLGDKPFRVLVCGGSGSGKSFLIARVLLSGKPFYNHKFAKIFWCNPTLMNTTQNNPYDLIDLEDGQHEIYDDMNDEILDDILQKLPISKKTGKKKPSLLILDDVGQLDRNSKFAKKIFIKLRHTNMSVIISVQKHTFLNKAIRGSLTHLILTTKLNNAMINDIISEFFPMNKKDGEKLIDEAFTEDETGERPFIFLDLVKNKIYKRFPDMD